MSKKQTAGGIQHLRRQIQIRTLDQSEGFRAETPFFHFLHRCYLMELLQQCFVLKMIYTLRPPEQYLGIQDDIDSSGFWGC